MGRLIVQRKRRQVPGVGPIVIGELQEAALDKIALSCENISKKWLEWN